MSSEEAINLPKWAIQGQFPVKGLGTCQGCPLKGKLCVNFVRGFTNSVIVS